MFSLLSRLTRLTTTVGVATVLTASALTAASTAAAVPVASLQGGKADPGCAISPTSVALDQTWTVSAWGLPTGGTVNQIISFPDGATSTGPITVASNGTYTTTGNSNMSATWGFVAPEQTGTYTYQYVGKIKWPAGTYNQLYATCTVQVG